tara:strand:- start:3336 stop:3746 length:411 start_codon:yes stop_codon:yes gene_type:complete
MNCPICLSKIGLIYKKAPCKCKLKYHRKCYNEMIKNNKINCCWCREKIVNKSNKSLESDIVAFLFGFILPKIFSNNNIKSTKAYVLLFFDTILLCELIENIYNIIVKKKILLAFIIISILIYKNILIKKYLYLINE